MHKCLWIVLSALVFAATVQGQNFTGTWKLNPEKSKNVPPTTAAQTLTIERSGPNSWRSAVDLVLKSGEKKHAEITRTCDGQEHPIPNTDETESCELLNTGERRFTEKRDGKIIVVVTSSVSTDGRTMTNRAKRPGRDESVLVFDRQ